MILAARGPELGAPQMIVSRIPFGFLGNILPAGLNSLVAGVGWFAVNSVSGAFALNSLIDIPKLLALLVIAVVQIAVAFLGHNLIQVFERYAFIALGIIFAITSIIILSKSHPGAPSAGHVPGGWLIAFGAAFGYAAGWNPYATDYTRYLPKGQGWAAGLWSGAGIFVSCVALEIVGAASVTIAAPGDGSYTDNFVEHLPTVMANLTLLAIVIGAICANAINVYSGSMSFLALGIELPLSLRRAIVAAVFGTAGFFLAWSGLHDAGQKYENFLLIISYWIGPWLGVVLVDQLLRRGQRVERFPLRPQAQPARGLPGHVHRHGHLHPALRQPAAAIHRLGADEPPRLRRHHVRGGLRHRRGGVLGDLRLREVTSPRGRRGPGHPDLTAIRAEEGDVLLGALPHDGGRPRFAAGDHPPSRSTRVRGRLQAQRVDVGRSVEDHQVSGSADAQAVVVDPQRPCAGLTVTISSSWCSSVSPLMWPRCASTYAACIGSPWPSGYHGSITESCPMQTLTPAPMQLLDPGVATPDRSGVEPALQHGVVQRVGHHVQAGPSDVADQPIGVRRVVRVHRRRVAGGDATRHPATHRLGDHRLDEPRVVVVGLVAVDVDEQPVLVGQGHGEPHRVDAVLAGQLVVRDGADDVCAELDRLAHQVRATVEAEDAELRERHDLQLDEAGRLLAELDQGPERRAARGRRRRHGCVRAGRRAPAASAGPDRPAPSRPRQ